MYVFVFLFLSACQVAPNKNQLTISINGDPKSIDPIYATDVRSGQICALLYDNLVKFGSNTEIEPSLAHSWTINNTNYTFNLRTNIYFHNGQKFRADNVKKSFERLLSPINKSHRTWLFNYVEGANEYKNNITDTVSGFKIINDSTFVIKLKQNYVPFLSLLAMPGASIVSDSLIGTGPWVLEEWIHDGHLLFKKNKNYFNGDINFEKLKIRILPEPLPRTAEFITGYLDIMEVPNSEFPLWASDSTFNKQIMYSNDLNIYYIGMNCERPPFNNKIVRQAMNYAINSRSIIKNILHDNASKASSPIPPQLLNNKTYSKYEYNPQKARNLLDEAGYPNGFSVELWQGNSDQVSYITEAIQAQLINVGITINIIKTDWSIYTQAINEGVPDMYYRSWYADYPDAENFLAPLFESSISKKRWNRYSNLQLDSLIYILQTDINNKSALIEANKILINDVPWIYLWHTKTPYIAQKNIINWTPKTMFNAEKFINIKYNDFIY